jgi:hypothetical protein
MPRNHFQSLSAARAILDPPSSILHPQFLSSILDSGTHQPMARQASPGCRKAGLPAGAGADRRRVVEQAAPLFLAGEAGEFRKQGMARREEGFLAVQDGRVVTLAVVGKVDLPRAQMIKSRFGFFLIAQCRPDFKPIVCVHAEQARRCAPDRRQPDDRNSVHCEMRFPILLSWIEQRDEAFRLRVNCRQVWPLESVTAGARERQVLEIIASLMLLGPHMLDLETDNWRCRVRQATIQYSQQLAARRTTRRRVAASISASHDVSGGNAPLFAAR